MSKELKIAYNSIPDLDDWGSDSFWDLGTWVAWHRGLVEHYGKAKDERGIPLADKIWLTAWAKQTAYSSPILALMQPSRFKSETDYLKQFPFIYQYSGLKKAMEQYNPLDSSYQASTSVANIGDKLIGAAESSADSISMTGKVLKYGVPTLFIAGIGLLILWGYNKAKA